MKGILVVAHGNREKETGAIFDTILSMVKVQLPETTIEYACLKYSDRTIEKGIEALAARGITEITIVPYFLFVGKHLKVDLPYMVAQCAPKFPEIQITIGEVLGIDQRLADILVDRINNSG
ncbi:MAG: CbiX/SirB N-terminal domain-containing protein [Treponema sp.]|nr:CbiX/SirB N-terminal domain-containing protein [Treponema sp.]